MVLINKAKDDAYWEGWYDGRKHLYYEVEKVLKTVNPL